MPSIPDLKIRFVNKFGVKCLVIGLQEGVASLRHAAQSPRRGASQFVALKQSETAWKCGKRVCASSVEKWLSKVLLLQRHHCTDIVLCWIS